MSAAGPWAAPSPRLVARADRLLERRVVPRGERWLAVANVWSGFIDVHVTLATTGRIRRSAISPPERPVDV